MIAEHGGTAIGNYVAAPRPEVARLPVRLPLRLPTLIGRENLLAEMQVLLTTGDCPRIVVLSGLGGVGKTSLGVEYAHRHLAEVGVAWLVRSEDAALLAQDLAELAAQVGGRDGPADLRDPVASAHAVLAAYPTEWMLIFDNAVSATSIERFVPPAGRGRVLVTSQNQHWPGRRILDVPVLDERSASGFLLSRTGDLDARTAAETADELGGLPLALEQAAAYIQATGGTLAGYLAQFRQRRTELLTRGQAEGHPLTAAATIGLALSQAEAENAAATGLLRLLACLASEPVPIGLLLSGARLAGESDHEVAALLAPLVTDPLAAGDAVAALRRYSLISPAADLMVVVHRLVQAVVVGLMEPDEAEGWKRSAVLLVDAAIPADTEMPAAWPACAALLPHAQAVLPEDSAGLWRIGLYLGESGRYASARDFWKKIADACQQASGEASADTLAARHELGRWTGRAGEPSKARDMYAELLRTCERTYGAKHPRTLTARHQLGFWTGRAGDPVLARDICAELVAERERALGPEHADTLTTRANLARFTGQAGDPALARDMYAKLLPDRERTLGRHHPATLTTRADLAYWTGQAGEPALARDMFAELRPIRERVLGPEHPRVLTTWASLAQFTGEAGDPAGARDLLAELLTFRERVLGAGHPETIKTQAKLRYWTLIDQSNR